MLRSTRWYWCGQASRLFIDTNEEAWALGTTWGTHIVWGTNVVWTNSETWATHIVWGSALIGKSVNGEYIVWGTADQPDNTVWGNLADAP